MEDRRKRNCAYSSQILIEKIIVFLVVMELQSSIGRQKIYDDTVRVVDSKLVELFVLNVLNEMTRLHQRYYDNNKIVWILLRAKRDAKI